MDNEILFKLYYVAWKQKNNVEKFEEYKGLDNQIDTIKDLLIEKENIEDILHHFSNTMFLDMWVDICLKNKDYFYKKVINCTKDMINNIVDTLYYISSDNLEDYLNYEGEDFIPVLNEQTFEIERNEVNSNKIMKNILLIIKKIDINIYNSINYQVKAKLKMKKKNINSIKDLWKTIKIKDNGEVFFDLISMSKLENVLINNPNLIKEYKSELDDYFNVLKCSYNL